MFYKLTNAYIQAHLNSFLCRYELSENDLLYEPDFVPETFTLEQKRQGEQLMFFSDLSFEEWIKNMLTEQLLAAEITFGLAEAVQVAYDNVLMLADLCKGKYDLFNQEVVDVLRRVTAYTVYGELTDNIDTASKFNAMAHRLMPSVINEFGKLDYSLEEKLKISIVSGLSGLDLKGATAAASTHSNDGIAMRAMYQMDDKNASDWYVCQLLETYKKREFPIFHFEHFLHLIRSRPKAKIVWFTDDIIESYFDLHFIECLIKQYDVHISLIPKNGRCGNDASYYDIMRMVGQSFTALTTAKRFKIIREGPLMAAANIKKFSESMMRECVDADFIVMKGCRISEMLNGGITKPTFSAFNIVRKISEMISGFSADANPSIFYYLDPGEYAFWGVRGHSDILESGCPLSTIRSRYQQYSDPDSVIDRFNSLKEIMVDYSANKRPLFQEMSRLSDLLVTLVEKTYDRVGSKYDSLGRRNSQNAESQKWVRLLNCVRDNYGDSKAIKLLDVGVGDGKGIHYAFEQGFDIYGCDISSTFIDITKAKLPDGYSDRILKCDMRALAFPDEFFQVVRHNATLVHMPIIGQGFGADLAIREANRVLQKNGLLYISLKLGENDKLCQIDTGDGLGVRLFQLYKKETVDELLNNNGFVIIDVDDILEQRSPECQIHWHNLVAKKIR